MYLVRGGKIVAHFFAFVWVHLIPIGNVNTVSKNGAVYLFYDDCSTAMRAFNNYIHYYMMMTIIFKQCVMVN